MADTPARNFGNVASDLHHAATGRSAEPAQSLLRLHAQIEALQRGDFESMFRDAHDDVTLEMFISPRFPFVSTAHGKTELLAGC